MTAREEARAGPGALIRFDAVERVVHWANAALFLALISTGALLYVAPLDALVGRRALVENIHVYCGLALPVPLALAVAGRWGSALRADLRRFNRWTRGDRLWLGALTRRPAERAAVLDGVEVGKFNAGQKLNAAFLAGAGVVMLASGIILRWFRPFPLSWREGATFVHNWLAVVLVVVLVGHVLEALSDREALRSMLYGRVSGPWIARHAPGWGQELDGHLAEGARGAVPGALSGHGGEVLDDAAGSSCRPGTS